MAMILSALLRRGAGRGYDTGEAPLAVEGRYWRRKALGEIVDIPLAPAKSGDPYWRGRAGERKPLWAVVGEEPPYEWGAPVITEGDVGRTRTVSLASNTSPSDKPKPALLPEDTSEVPDALRATAHREAGDPGLYLTGHHVFSVGPVHTAIEFIAEDGTRHVISAGSKVGRLVGGVDERRSDKPKNNIALGTIKPPSGMAAEEYYQRLVNADQAYRDRADYDLFPEMMDGYNSNSYVRGLLDHTGGTYSVDFDGLVGGGSPLPGGAFDPNFSNPAAPQHRKPGQGPRSIH